MSDHLDSPGNINVETAKIGPPMGNAKTDITDLYAFLKPADPSKSILVLGVNPLTLASSFEHEGQYLINIDTDGDADADIVFEITFTAPDQDREQWATVRRLWHGDDGEHEAETIISGAPVSFGRRAKITPEGPYRFYAGVRSDPFFFDLLGFINNLTFNQGDFFADKNVFAIVLEAPNEALGQAPSTTSLWARTLLRENGHLVRDDRVGRAAINTVFNHGTDKNIFNGLNPSQDPTALNSEGMTFRASFAGTLVTLSTSTGHPYTATQAADLAAVLLPDVLNYDVSKPTSYASLNGRTLTDDVIDISLSLVTNGGLTTDNVGPHTDYLDHFPYLGDPH